jgi:hypothetical protein
MAHYRKNKKVRLKERKKQMDEQALLSNTVVYTSSPSLEAANCAATHEFLF